MLQERNIRVRNSSVKWEKLSPNIIGALQKSGITGLTVAPETGSERLRQAMRKPMAEDRFIERIKNLFDHGFEHIKMYFVSCLPGEEEEDIDATTDFINRVIKVAPSISSLSATFSVFVPKNHTPWQNEPAPEQYFIKKRIKYIKEQLAHLGQFKANFESPQDAVRQAYLSQVGPELGEEYSKAAQEQRANKLFSKGQFTSVDF